MKIKDRKLQDRIYDNREQGGRPTRYILLADVSRETAVGVLY